MGTCETSGLACSAAGLRIEAMHEGDTLPWRFSEHMVVVRFGDKYKQWNAAFDAGYCAALGKPYVTLHDESVVHPLKEVDAGAQAWCTTTDQVVEILRYVLEA